MAVRRIYIVFNKQLFAVRFIRFIYIVATLLGINITKLYLSVKVEYNENKKNLTLPDFTFVFPPASSVFISGDDATQCT